MSARRERALSGGSGDGSQQHHHVFSTYNDSDLLFIGFHLLYPAVETFSLGPRRSRRVTQQRPTVCALTKRQGEERKRRQSRG